MKFNKNWSAGLKWRYAGGLPYTPYNLELSSRVNCLGCARPAYLDKNRINSERLGDFHQLDIRVDKKFFFDKWSLMLYLDIQNLYNFKSKQPDYIVREKDADGNFITQTDINNVTRYQLKSIPSESGTVLPTIGIMIEF
jgi:hypothetical protein